MSHLAGSLEGDRSLLRPCRGPSGGGSAAFEAGSMRYGEVAKSLLDFGILREPNQIF
jgi:hypothetical protein